MVPVAVGLPGLPALFDETIPNAPMLFAVLEGRAQGRALADDPETPTIAAVQTAEGVAFLSRLTTQADCDRGLAALRRDATIGLVWADEDGVAIVPEAPARVIDRLGFEAIPAASHMLQALAAALPAGDDARPMDAALLERCEWADQVIGAHGSVESFLANGAGLCIMRGDEILAEAYAPFIGHGVAEVGVVTREAHRRHGYAAIAIACLADRLAGTGLAMYWSCDADNVGSIRVAEKVGFAPPRPFRLLLYRQLPR
jgi:GNAT superfamily N-acetyltransferase